MNSVLDSTGIAEADSVERVHIPLSSAAVRIAQGEQSHTAESSANASADSFTVFLSDIDSLIGKLDAVLQAMEDDRRWDTLFNDPRSEAVLDRLVEEAFAEEDAGLTLDMDGLM